MRRLLDYNPLTGERVWFGADSANSQITITHEQDVTQHLARSHERMVNDDYTKQGIKNDWWQYASVPNIIIIEMKQKHGVDFFDKNDWPRVIHLLNTEYKNFKTTSKTHNVKHA